MNWLEERIKNYEQMVAKVSKDDEKSSAYKIDNTESNQYYDLYTFLNDLVSFKTVNDLSGMDGLINPSGMTEQQKT